MESKQGNKMDAGFIYYLNGEYWDNMMESIWESSLNLDADTIRMICGA